MTGRIIKAVRPFRGGWRVTLWTLDVLFASNAARLDEIKKAARIVGKTVARQLRDFDAGDTIRADSAAGRGFRVFQSYLAGGAR